MIKHLYNMQFNITLLFQKYRRIIWKQNNTPLTIINKDIKEAEKWNTLPESSFESLYNLKTLLEKKLLLSYVMLRRIIIFRIDHSNKRNLLLSECLTTNKNLISCVNSVVRNCCFKNTAFWLLKGIIQHQEISQIHNLQWKNILEY